MWQEKSLKFAMVDKEAPVEVPRDLKLKATNRELGNWTLDKDITKSWRMKETYSSTFMVCSSIKSKVRGRNKGKEKDPY